jgi:hypothetical protein
MGAGQQFHILIRNLGASGPSGAGPGYPLQQKRLRVFVPLLSLARSLRKPFSASI